MDSGMLPAAKGGKSSTNQVGRTGLTIPKMEKKVTCKLILHKVQMGQILEIPKILGDASCGKRGQTTVKIRLVVRD